MMKNITLIAACFFLSIPWIRATDLPFRDGEELTFDIHYKYGFVMLKAGTAEYFINDGSYNNKSAWNTTLNFKTTAFFDKIFKIRDSMYSQVNVNLEPLYHWREVNEGHTYFREEIVFNKYGKAYSEVHVKQENRERVKLDTILTANNPGYDLLNILMFARSLDYPRLKHGESFNLSTFIGKSKVNIIVHFEGQTVINKSETLKYNAYKLTLDITDEVFSGSKNAMEVWISNDKNHIPLKLKAKLKIGAAEAELTSYKNLKYPLSSEIKIPAN
ncbi:hypothetical protein FACS189432_05830 [Bacteroidia bacterium]|nr:hypothetical protein FACS189426_09360 [Bacteroidia bacterium]GHT28214.1 hypothetical protein FACS189432_05830 [Bacteroidia bacterium]GHV70830.1 hypothetical protein FACS189420_3540 [Bacteroidia bacterium]